MTRTQQEVYNLLEIYGPLPDHAMVPLAQHLLNCHQSSSGLRSRRAELTHKGLVKPAGSITMPSGRSAITWMAI